MDLVYLAKNEIKVDNINNLLAISDLADLEKLPDIDKQEKKLSQIKKDRWL